MDAADGAEDDALALRSTPFDEDASGRNGLGKTFFVTMTHT
ncbi:hypothetical protein BSU04_23180 [Caballeronia sordidicola]|uniref:Uncharacterized protein n=1 Tax=Caballeronia sordidicola TaxID=196367 RepID=A0A226WZY6_CABSO|nr:hypothetical protein BSU04_23180 [Caballeronia sordidicola]